MVTIKWRDKLTGLPLPPDVVYNGDNVTPNMRDNYGTVLGFVASHDDIFEHVEAYYSFILSETMRDSHSPYTLAEAILDDASIVRVAREVKELVKRLFFDAIDDACDMALEIKAVQRLEFEDELDTEDQVDRAIAEWVSDNY